jgi:hypothetical protein
MSDSTATPSLQRNSRYGDNFLNLLYTYVKHFKVKVDSRIETSEFAKLLLYTLLLAKIKEIIVKRKVILVTGRGDL